MGYATDILRAGWVSATGFLNRRFGRVDLSEEDDDRTVDSDLARSLQVDEDLRSGKSRMLSAEESDRVIKRLKHKWGME